MKKVIITGATSSIGIALIEDCIKNNVEVLALCRNTSNRLKNLPKSNLITVKNCDLKELENFELKGNVNYYLYKLLNLIWTMLGYAFLVFMVNMIEDTMISTTIKKLKAKEYCKFTPGEHIWDYLYSSDAGNAFYLLGKKLEGNKVYCLGSGKGKPLKEYIQIIKEEIDPKAKIGLGDIEYINGIPNPMVADISNLTKDTGFTPQTDFIEGIRKITLNI